jgi:hypothetical protein
MLHQWAGGEQFSFPQSVRGSFSATGGQPRLILLQAKCGSCADHKLPGRSMTKTNILIQHPGGRSLQRFIRLAGTSPALIKSGPATVKNPDQTGGRGNGELWRHGPYAIQQPEGRIEHCVLCLYRFGVVDHPLKIHDDHGLIAYHPGVVTRGEE